MGGGSVNSKIEKLDKNTKKHITKEVVDFIINNTKFNIDEIFSIINRFEKLEPNKETVINSYLNIL